MENLKITQPAIINYNFETVREGISARLEEYKGAVFTEDSKNVAKKEVASLRKEKKSLSDRVKEVKAEYMKPWDEFEGQAKALINLYDEPINLIDGQVKEFEEKRKEEKKARILELYNEIFDTDLVSLEKIYNPKWENATFKEKEIVAEMQDRKNKIESDMRTLRIVADESDVSDVINKYLQDFCVTDAINLAEERKRVRADAVKREEERKAREEEERIRREERERLLAEQRAEEEKRRTEEEKAQAVEQAKEEVIENFVPEDSGESNFYEYAIELSQDAKEKLEMFMDSIGVNYICKGVM